MSKLVDRPGIAGLSAFGLPGTKPAVAHELDVDRTAADTRFAISTLAGVLGGVYVASGLTLLGRLDSEAWLLVAIGFAQAGWAAAAHRGARPAVLIGGGLNCALLVLWLLSHTVGVSLTPGGRQPIGVLDSLCAVDAAVVGLLVLISVLGSSRREGALTHLAVLLAVLTVSALLGGHTHTAQAAALRGGTGAVAHVHLYCRLL